MPAVLMKIPSPLPRSTTLVSPVTIEIARHGAGHGQIVDRAADRQLADIAAGKPPRADHVGIGRKGEPLAAANIEHDAVVRRRGRLACRRQRCELRKEKPFDQVSHHPPPAAVG